MSVWAISAYFNPASYVTRRANYHHFRSALEVPLITVELSHDGQFELGSDDADILVQISEPSVLWQKERLLNLALEALPDCCEVVAWLDCDIIFARQSWASGVEQALKGCCWLQPFSELCDLERGKTPAQGHGVVEAPGRRSVVQMLESGELPDNFFSLKGASVQWRFTAGHAWAARRDVLQAVGLYDAAILGSGNKLMLAAGYGRQAEAAEAYNLSGPQRLHYLAWAEHFRARMGKPGWIVGRIDHLWHGDLALRGYGSRHDALRHFDFDPFSDIEKSPSGAWEWGSEKPELHRYVEEFFRQRREDG
jgi:hypothetical protein